MSEVLSDRWITKTRKPHQCDWCSESIPVASRARYTAIVQGSDFYSGHTHPECYHAMQSIPGLEEFDFGTHSRGRTDDRQEPPQYTPDGDRIEAINQDAK